MKKQLNVLFLLFSLAFVGQLSAIKSINDLYEQAQDVAQRSAGDTRPAYLASVLRRLEKMQGELAEKKAETLDQAVMLTFLNEFLPLLLDFIRLQINFHDIAVDDYAALADLACRAEDLHYALLAHGPQGLAVNKFGADHELLVDSTKSFLKKILTAQLFVAIERADVEAVRNLLARGADANGTNANRRSPMDVAYLIPTVPDYVDRADAEACDMAAAAKMAIQSLLVEHKADVRTVDIDILCARLAAQRVVDVPVEPELEPEEEDKGEQEEAAAVIGVAPVVVAPSAEPERSARARGKKKAKKKKRGKSGKQRAGQQAAPVQVDQAELVQKEKFSTASRKEERRLIRDFIEATQHGQPKKLEKAIKRLLKSNKFSVNDVEVVGDCRTAPLICFATYQDNGSLELLLKYKDRLKLNLELRDTDERTSLHIAIFRCCVPHVRALVRAGADVNATLYVGRGSNTLHAALLALHQGCTDDPRIFLTLLESERPINLECRAAGMTPLHIAVTFNQPAVTRALVAAGAKINARSEKDASTALMLAVCSKDRLCARILLEAGADGRLADSGGIMPLHQAAGTTDVGMMQLLLNYPNLMDVNQRTEQGTTVLQILCCRGAAERDLELAHRVVLAGVDLNATVGSGVGTTVLNWACARPDFELVKFMCEHGADVNHIGPMQMCPLWVAQESCRVYLQTSQLEKVAESEKIVALLKERGAYLEDGGGDDGSDA